jgi:ABC-type lipoprotein release transport system permease subunit
VAFWLAYVAAVGASVLVAVNRSEALFQWERAAVFFLFFVVLAWLLSRDTARVETLAAALAMICLALALVGAVQLVRVAVTDGWNLENTYKVLGLSAARNLYSQTLLMTVPFAVYWAARGRRLWRAASALGAVLSLVLLTALMVRSVWIGAVVASLASTGVGVLGIRKQREGHIS